MQNQNFLINFDFAFYLLFKFTFEKKFFVARNFHGIYRSYPKYGTCPIKLMYLIFSTNLWTVELTPAKVDSFGFKKK